jgi:hypothetical protein
MNVAVVEEPPPKTELKIVDAFIATAFGADFNDFSFASLSSSFDAETFPPPAFSDELDNFDIIDLEYFEPDECNVAA